MATSRRSKNNDNLVSVRLNRALADLHTSAASSAGVITVFVRKDVSLERQKDSVDALFVVRLRPVLDMRATNTDLSAGDVTFYCLADAVGIDI